jgi:ubiquinone biosynthesis accessory factor UbiJ
MLTARIQAAVDREVAGSPRARELLAELAGRTLQVTLRFTPWRAWLHASGQRLLITRSESGSADASVSGSPLAMLAMLREPPEDVIQRGDVRIEGDAEVARKFQQLAELLRPDLEEALSRIVGDVPAHGIGNFLRRALDYGRGSARTAAMNVGEYLTHERRELVPRAEADPFLKDVDTLRESTDRLAARVAELEAREVKS